MLYDKLRERKYLTGAWNVVRASALKSRDDFTKSNAIDFDRHAQRNLDRIASQLREERYKFKPAKGVPIPRAGKAPRPIVVAHIEDRIVQRAILDVLHDEDSVSRFLKHRGSFGGLPETKIRDAIEAVCIAMSGGADYVIQSDIRGFFKEIDRASAIDALVGVLPDDSLKQIIKEATDVEFGNIEDLGGAIEHFPDEETGVAQGSALSPLLGNVYLYEFDEMFNDGEIQCIRWIDDFALLANDHSSAWSAFSQARQYLKAKGMDVYMPNENTEKAHHGPTKKAFDFLGCSINTDRVLPSKKAKRRLLDRIEADIDKSRHQMYSSSYESISHYDFSLVETLKNVSDRVRGWTNAYAFCNQQGFDELDEEIDGLLRGYIGAYADYRSRLGRRSRRRLLGVWLTVDQNQKVCIPAESRPPVPVQSRPLIPAESRPPFRLKAGQHSGRK